MTIRSYKTLTSALLIAITAFTTFAQTSEEAYEKEVSLADHSYWDQDYAEALIHYTKSFALGNQYRVCYYRAAHAAAATNKKNEAFKYLIKCISLGYIDKTWISSNKAFAPIRTDKRWNKVIAEIDKQLENITRLLAHLKGKTSTDLIPFKTNGSWGYVDKNTLQIVVQPVFKELSFMGTCTELYYKDFTRIRVNPQGEILALISSEREENDEAVSVEISSSDQGPYPAHGMKGFKMNDKNEIIAFSNAFNRYQPEFFNISAPFLIDGKFYAIAHKPAKSGIIDQDGNPLPRFDFVHDELILNSRKLNDIRTWFYFKNEEGKGGFINDLGETKLAGELIGYPFLSNDVLSYGIQHNDTSWGILDQENMAWVIKPQPLRITQISYAYHGDCQKSHERSDVAALYFLVVAGNDAYYLDQNLKAYRPK